MGLNIVTSLDIFPETCNAINANVSLVQEKCAQSLSEANRKLDETQEELAYSRRLLQEAIAEEHRCLMIVHECEAEVAAAAAGLPETAAWLAEAERRLAIAVAEYEKAVAHRILMEQRVALAEQCVSIASEMVETLVAKYNYGQNQISRYAEVGISRLNAADKATTGYVKETVNRTGQTDVFANKSSESDPKRINCPNERLVNDVHPETGVPFKEKIVVDEFGRKLIVVVPVFPSVFETYLPKNLQQASDRMQFNECNEQLKNKCSIDSKFSKIFSEEQLEQIMNADTPDGFTWHHNEDIGKMQLVDSSIHGKTAHLGGRNIWGGGSANR